MGFENGAINVCDTFDMTAYDGITGAHEMRLLDGHGG